MIQITKKESYRTSGMENTITEMKKKLANKNTRGFQQQKWAGRRNNQ